MLESDTDDIMTSALSKLLQDDSIEPEAMLPIPNRRFNPSQPTGPG